MVSYALSELGLWQRCRFGPHQEELAPSALPARSPPVGNFKILPPTALPPMIAQRICPVMKLPGSTLIPCRDQMAPKATSNPPTMFKATFMIREGVTEK